MRKVLIALFLFIPVTANLAFAATPRQRSITIMGPCTCQEWIDAEQKERAVGDDLTKWIPAASNRRWALGVITGINGASDLPHDALKSVDSEVVFDWIRQYCRSHQTADVYDALQELWLSLARISLKKPALTSRKGNK